MPSEKINVGGIAVRAGLSLNRILYIPEELKKFAPTMVRRPILKDHINTTDNTVGLITASHYNDATTEVDYAGWIKDDGNRLLERIDDGRIKEVSIGAVVGRLVKENLDDDFTIAKDMRAMELSTTPTPANVGTSLRQTLKGLSEAKTKEERQKIKPILENINLINENYIQNLKPIIETKETKEEIIISKFICPLCEIEVDDIKSLRTHMKIHNKEPEQENLKNNMEDIKMADIPDIKVTVDTNEVDTKLKDLETKQNELADREKAIKTREDTIAKETRKKIETEYSEIAKQKDVTARDISKLSDDIVKELIEQLKLVQEQDDDDDKIKCPECGKMIPKEDMKKHMADEHPEEKKSKSNMSDETKGKVNRGEVDDKKDDVLSDYEVEKSEFGKGYSLYMPEYKGEKLKRLVR